MYRSNKLGIIDWIVLLVILAIPVVNIIVGILLYIRPGTSSTVRSFLVALLIMILAGAILSFTTGVIDSVTDLIGGF